MHPSSDAQNFGSSSGKSLRLFRKGPRSHSLHSWISEYDTTFKHRKTRQVWISCRSPSHSSKEADKISQNSCEKNDKILQEVSNTEKIATRTKQKPRQTTQKGQSKSKRPISKNLPETPSIGGAKKLTFDLEDSPAKETLRGLEPKTARKPRFAMDCLDRSDQGWLPL